MSYEAACAQVVSHEHKATPHQYVTEVQETSVQAGAAALPTAVLASDRPGIEGLALRLPYMDGAARARTISQLQRTYGNAYVQRVMVSLYTAGPAVQRQAEDVESVEAVEPVPPVSGQGQPKEVIAHAGPRRLPLQGLTRARFNGGSFRTEGVVTGPGTGCRACRGRDCVHVTGTVVTDYQVTTTVTLPRVPDGLTPCQRERVQDAINNVLAPHEQEHVAAFETYNGTTRQPFDLTLCRAQFPQAIRDMVRTEERQRRAAAQAASDALDPFNFEVDLECTD